MNIGFVPTACCTVNVSILNPNGTRLVNPIAVASGQVLMDAKTLPTTGTYTIVVDPYQTAGGTVTLTLFDLPPDVSATATLGGPAETLTTVAAGQNARALFTGTAGDGVIVRTGPANCCSTSVSVVKPDGTTLVGPFSFTTAGGFIYTEAHRFGDVHGRRRLSGHLAREHQRLGWSGQHAAVGSDVTLSTSTPDAFVQGATVFYRPAAATGMFTVTANVTDGGSGVQSDLPRFERRSTPTTGATDTASPYLQN